MVSTSEWPSVAVLGGWGEWSVQVSGRSSVQCWGTGVSGQYK